MNDLLRLLTVFACAFSIGVIGVMYATIGRWFLPRVWMRLLMVGTILMLFGTASASVSRIGEPTRWWNWILATGTIAMLTAFVGLHHWYGTPPGRAHAAKMREQE